MSKYVYGLVLLLIAALTYGCWHYQRSASSWQRTSEQQQHRAKTAEQANETLATANATLNARNNNLVESLNERSEELKRQRQRADANRYAYQSALDANADWGNTRVPAAVADSLRAATSVQGDPGTADSNPR